MHALDQPRSRVEQPGCFRADMELLDSLEPRQHRLNEHSIEAEGARISNTYYLSPLLPGIRVQPLDPIAMRRYVGEVVFSPLTTRVVMERQGETVGLAWPKVIAQ